MINEINIEFNETARKKALKSVGAYEENISSKLLDASSIEEENEGGSLDSSVSEQHKKGTIEKVQSLKDKIEMSLVLKNNIKELI